MSSIGPNNYPTRLPLPLAVITLDHNPTDKTYGLSPASLAFNKNNGSLWYLKSARINDVEWVNIEVPGIEITAINVDTSTSPGTNPVLSGDDFEITITGGQVVAGTTANVIQTNSLAPNAFTIQVQRAAAEASPTLAANGVSHFDSSQFSVDNNGFVSLIGGGTAIDSVSGDDAVIVSPAANGNLNVKGQVIPNTSGIATTGDALTNTLNISMQSPYSLGAFSFTGGTLSVTNGNFALSNTTATIGAITIGGNRFVHNFGGANSVYLGTNAGNLSVSNTGTRNTGTGFGSLLSVTSGSDNGAFSQDTLNLLTTGSQNLAGGSQSGMNLVTGSNNTLLGYQTGSSYTGAESNNILIGSQVNGTLGESNVIRIGSTQTTSYMAGVSGVAVSNLNLVTINTATGQLGSEAMPSSSISLTGDTGGALTGSSFTIYAHNSTNNAGASVLISGSGTTLTLNTSDSNSNTFIGNLAGNTTLSGNSNTGLGVSCLPALTTGQSNVVIGSLAGNKITTSSENTALGITALFNLLTGNGRNTAIGDSALSQITTGDTNTVIGYSAGSGLTLADSSNILIGYNAAGTAGDVSTIRIGVQGGPGGGQQNKCFIAGINGVTTTNTQLVTINSSTGQLGATAAASVIFAWSDASGSFSATAGNGYFLSGASTPTLPTNPAEGTTIAFICDTASTVTVTAGGTNTIRVGSVLSAAGGTTASSAQGNSLTLVFRTTGSVWICLGAPQGTWTTT